MSFLKILGGTALYFFGFFIILFGIVLLFLFSEVVCFATGFIGLIFILVGKFYAKANYQGAYNREAGNILYQKHGNSFKSKNESRRRCPKCGRVIPEDSKMCPYCGNDFQLQPVQTPIQERKIQTEEVFINCSQCGNRFAFQKNINYPTQVQCPYCGKVGTI